MDTEKSGRLTRKQLTMGFEKNGVHLSDEEVDDLFKSFGREEEGCIDHTEWLAATVGTTAITAPEVWQSAFHSLDFERSGKISGSDIALSSFPSLGNLASDTSIASGDDFSAVSDSVFCQTKFKKLVEKIAKRRGSNTYQPADLDGNFRRGDRKRKEFSVVR
eukprot:CAMPEP_0170650084 /NCGR_PEP_ID=MMETSP0224-20130122/45625_1 /TAXON_ID=285029 /ORGANISM="Togula jolla, Strain CCCM 725" /LENGTH=161 /DNA_ID=CAMNT_0010981745 /DNA_START=135 /DNA_END=616 /DNA_ORIENTATION=+